MSMMSLKIFKSNFPAEFGIDERTKQKERTKTELAYKESPEPTAVLDDFMSKERRPHSHEF